MLSDLGYSLLSLGLSFQIHKMEVRGSKFPSSSDYWERPGILEQGSSCRREEAKQEDPEKPEASLLGLGSLCHAPHRETPERFPSPYLAPAGSQ